MAKTQKKRKPDSSRDTLTLTAVIVVSAAVIAAGAAVGIWKLCRAVTGMAAFHVRPGEIVLENPWIKPEAARDDFRRTDPTGVLRGEWSIFAPGLAERVADAYDKSPWVIGRPAVRKVFPNTLDVRLELREPFALVSTGGKCYCLDRDGVVLSAQVYDLTVESTSILTPLAVLEDHPRPPRDGEVWDDVSVLGGLEMVELCRSRLAKSVIIQHVEVRTVRSPRAMPIAMARLKLAAGPVVEWGRVPSDVASAAEVSTEKKVESLLWAITQEGSNLGRLKLIDVRYSPPIRRE